MTVWVDTSAVYALMDSDDDFHGRSVRVMGNIAQKGETLVTCNYVIVETFALLQGRLGIPAARAFMDDVLPVIDVEWVDEATHQAAAAAVLAAGRKRLSLVDCVSFEIMRRMAIRTAFAFDTHFDRQGFVRIPRR